MPKSFGSRRKETTTDLEEEGKGQDVEPSPGRLDQGTPETEQSGRNNLLSPVVSQVVKATLDETHPDLSVGEPADE